ncbi:zinc finger protein basonuclin-2-like isoform X6 [Apodemus sylvaticus]|uniref:zinc finger protein basonuclin-2-like isoform X6 n=1 Tax=Apodemus sylvaticus TaxID=10129 RepID=UPI00224246C8|nr:zinc finger protein basonuclin-2-like isoform X6 [Apodemus sylvaticus]
MMDCRAWLAHFVPSPPPNCLSYKSEGRLGDQDWQAHFKVPCCGVDPSQLESEEAEVDVRERDTQRDREPKRARDLTLRDSCTDNSMQFGTRTTAAGPGFMGTWQNADTNLLFRMSQQNILRHHDVTLPPQERFQILSALEQSNEINNNSLLASYMSLRKNVF